MKQLIIFSDLDGTLLDHETYSWAAAEPALAALRHHKIPLMLASSKTAAEIAPLRAELGFVQCPAIVENGAGILEPGDDGTKGGDEDYKAIRKRLAATPGHLRELFDGFGDWSIAELAERTGLPVTEAALARWRRFSEPGLWHGTPDELTEFGKWLKSHDISMRRGGRFITLSLGADKAKAMASITEQLQHNTEASLTIALGDAPNDAAMLEAANIGFIIANPHGAGMPELPGEKAGRIRRTQKAGPAGWNDAVLSVLKDHGYEC